MDGLHCADVATRGNRAMMANSCTSPLPIVVTGGDVGKLGHVTTRDVVTRAHAGGGDPDTTRGGLSPSAHVGTKRLPPGGGFVTTRAWRRGLMIIVLSVERVTIGDGGDRGTRSTPARCHHRRAGRGDGKCWPASSECHHWAAWQTWDTLLTSRQQKKTPTTARPGGRGTRAQVAVSTHVLTRHGPRWVTRTTPKVCKGLTRATGRAKMAPKALVIMVVIQSRGMEQ